MAQDNWRADRHSESPHGPQTGYFYRDEPGRAGSDFLHSRRGQCGRVTAGPRLQASYDHAGLHTRYSSLPRSLVKERPPVDAKAGKMKTGTNMVQAMQYQTAFYWTARNTPPAIVDTLLT